MDQLPHTPSFLPFTLFCNTMARICKKVKVKVKVKWSRYRSGVAQSVGRGIALLFHDRGTRRGWGFSSTPRPHFIPGKDPVPILQKSGWAPGPVWTGGKSRHHRDSIPGIPARSSVAIPTELPGPRLESVLVINRKDECTFDVTSYLLLSIEIWGRDSSGGIANLYELDGPGIESRWGWVIPHPSRPALGPKQPPIQWVPGVFPGVKRPGRGVDHLPHLAPRLRKE